ncbi:hypothetical protein HDU96_006989 [Phlyctochytrium bullatum]|nr:hypothetical protein HDU96_006989 [Phlyctochytrium bullatum]
MSLKSEIIQWNEGCEAFDRGNYYDALAAFIPVANISRMHFNVAMAYKSLGRPHDCIAALTNAIDCDAYLAVAFFQRGLLFYSQALFAEALADFNDVLGHLRGNACIDYTQLGLAYRLHVCEAMYNRGLCFAALGQIQAALADFDEAMRRRPKDRPRSDFDRIEKALVQAGDAPRYCRPFSMPSGLVFRPDAEKVKNAGKVEYLGRAMVVATVDATDTTSSFKESKFRTETLSRKSSKSQLPSPASPASSDLPPWSSPVESPNGLKEVFAGRSATLGRLASLGRKNSLNRSASPTTPSSADLPPWSSLPPKEEGGVKRSATLGRMGGLTRKPSLTSSPLIRFASLTRRRNQKDGEGSPGGADDDERPLPPTPPPEPETETESSFFVQAGPPKEDARNGEGKRMLRRRPSEPIMSLKQRLRVETAQQGASPESSPVSAASSKALTLGRRRVVPPQREASQQQDTTEAPSTPTPVAPKRVDSAIAPADTNVIHFKCHFTDTCVIKAPRTIQFELLAAKIQQKFDAPRPLLLRYRTFLDGCERSVLTDITCQSELEAAFVAAGVDGDAADPQKRVLPFELWCFL